MVGVIFDFNGTLFYDSDKQEKAWQIFSEKVFRRTITQEEFRRFIHGRSNDFILQYLSETPLGKDQTDRYAEEKEAIYRDLCDADPLHSRLTWDVKLLLSELRDRRIPRTIATASQKTNVDYYIKKFHLEKWFDVDKIVYNDGTIPGKPNPDLYIRAAKAIGMEPQNCIVFEDAVSGIQSARNAGIGKIIAIAPKGQESLFEQLPGVYDVISAFHQFDRFLLRE